MAGHAQAAVRLGSRRSIFPDVAARKPHDDENVRKIVDELLMRRDRLRLLPGSNARPWGRRRRIVRTSNGSAITRCRGRAVPWIFSSPSISKRGKCFDIDPHLRTRPYRDLGRERMGLPQANHTRALGRFTQDCRAILGNAMARKSDEPRADFRASGIGIPHDSCGIPMRRQARGGAARRAKSLSNGSQQVTCMRPIFLRRE